MAVSSRTLKKGAIDYQWLGHATILGESTEPAAHRRIIGIFANSTNVIFEVDEVLDLSPNVTNGFVPEAHGIIWNGHSDSISTDPVINPINSCVVRFKKWTKSRSGRVNRNANFQSPFQCEWSRLMLGNG